MPIEQTKIIQDASDVDTRLVELGLHRTGLLEIATQAKHEGTNATPFHAANAAGTFSYQHGTFALRNQFVGQDWKPARPEGVETIFNEALNLHVGYANVDISCDKIRDPKPRSRKGAGAERACYSSIGLFDHLPSYAPRPAGGAATYYLMVDDDGQTELTRPVVQRGTFTAYVERIFLGKPDDGTVSRLPLDADDAVTGFDPQVARK